MDDMIRAAIMGVVEGVTEFLPISSTGHMILFERPLGIVESDFWKAFEVVIQTGAILAVVVYFWQRLWKLAIHPAGKPWQEHIAVKLFVAFLPAAVIGLLAGKWIQEHLFDWRVVAATLVLGGVGILVIEAVIRHPRIHDAAEISLKTAFLIGLAQCVAMIPGTSRSAATIMGALLLGLTPAAAAEFSFFLAIPTLLAAGGYSLLKYAHILHREEMGMLLVGFGVSFVVALAVVRFLMKFIQTHKFTLFAVYRIILGAIVVVVYQFLWKT